MRGGDFNTDISRSNSLHTTSLMRFVQNEHMILLDDLPTNPVDNTFEIKHGLLLIILSYPIMCFLM